MPRFYFHLRAHGEVYPDVEGSECLDVETARLHAARVARELMRNAERGMMLWSLRVEDDRQRHVLDLFFADVPNVADDRWPERRVLAGETSRRLAALVDLRASANETMAESAALLARARRKPQLAFRRKNAQPK